MTESESLPYYQLQLPGPTFSIVTCRCDTRRDLSYALTNGFYAISAPEIILSAEQIYAKKVLKEKEWIKIVLTIILKIKTIR